MLSKQKFAEVKNLVFGARGRGSLFTIKAWNFSSVSTRTYRRVHRAPPAFLGQPELPVSLCRVFFIIPSIRRRVSRWINKSRHALVAAPPNVTNRGMPLFSAERRSSDSESIYPRFKTKYCAWRGNKGTRDPRVHRVVSSCYCVQKSTIFFIDATSNHTDRNFSYFRIEYFRKMLELITERRLHRSFRIMLRIKYLIRFSLLFFLKISSSTNRR